MWFSLSVILLTAWTCLADPADTMTHSMSAHRSASTRSRRMVGGTLAPHVPWQAMVYLGDSLLDGGFAGGALICDRWILTAGRNLFVNKSRQAIQGKAPTIPKVYLDISSKEQATAAKEHAVQKVVLHPHFQAQSDWDNDLALIQLKDPVVLSKTLIPIPLPCSSRSHLTEVGRSGAIAGWGLGALLTPASSIKHLVLPFANQSECKEEYEHQKHTPAVDDHMFCTGPTVYEENVCFGDAGGALAVRDPIDGDVYAVGILSYDKCCRTSKYAVYMKLTAYLPWIHHVIRGDTTESAKLRSTVMAEMYSRQPQTLPAV
ncbi:haptoglobin [Lampris incognitus]|uniref:haptoglobin n=1 Tax=Lampris incognitus TaxID=2546036 RepID=UPI0024B508F1|nr:haptoglobin [Lampris incognitus]